MGVICCGAATIPEEMFLVSAQKLATLVSEDDLNNGSLYPPLGTIRDCSLKIAVDVMNYAYENGKSNRNGRSTMESLNINFHFYFLSHEKNRFGQRSSGTTKQRGIHQIANIRHQLSIGYSKDVGMAKIVNSTISHHSRRHCRLSTTTTTYPYPYPTSY